MKKDPEKHKESKSKDSDSSLKSFLKKRAPLYLGLMGLFAIFVIPALTEGNLQSSLPQDLEPEQQQIVDILMTYKGPNETGLSVFEALENKIKEEYPDEKIFDNDDTIIDLTVTQQDSSYKVNFVFESHKGTMEYLWDVNSDTRQIMPLNEDAKNIINLVDFYD